MEIAGNDDILISIVTPKNWEFTLNVGDKLFSMPVLADKNFNRVVISVPVKNLHSVLNYIKTENVRLEHIYDY